jgi:hypothetical protein
MILISGLLWPPITRAQTLAPVNPGARSTATAAPPPPAATPLRETTPATENPTTPKAKTTTTNRLFLPLWKADEKSVEAFYQTSNWIAPLQQVKFLYGFGQRSKTLSVDLVSMEFPAGIQTTFGSTVTAPSTKDTATTTNADSATQALERLKAGGDFFVRTAYPLYAVQNAAKTSMFTVFSISTLGLNISGLGDETTITQATEHNFNTGVEAYGQYGAIGGKGFLYADYRGGLQTVQTDFARSVGLPHKNFGMQQFCLGLQMGGFLRIGFQKFFGPAAAFGTTRDDLSKWHLVLQVIPLGK